MKTTTDPIEGLARVVQAVTRMMSETRQEYLSGDSFFNLSMSQIHTLELIAEMDDPTPTDLAARLGHSKASASATIAKLKQEGYIETLPSEQDGRSYHIHLSEKGEQAQRVHHQVHQKIARLLVAGLSQAEIEQLLCLMVKAMPETID